MAGAQLAAGGVVPHVEGAVFADHTLHRPHARKVVAPAGGPAGDRDHAQAGAVQCFQGLVGRGREPAFGGQRVVDVGQHAVHAGGHGTRHFGQGPQTWGRAHRVNTAACAGGA
jgi:hypothetical protein